jgi:hypothetical protein
MHSNEGANKPGKTLNNLFYLLFFYVIPPWQGPQGLQTLQVESLSS